MPYPFSENNSSPADRAWASNTSPFLGTLGPNRTTATPTTNPFVAKLKDNPKYPSFYNAEFSPDDVKKSQREYEIETVDPNPNLANGPDNPYAKGFLDRYVVSMLVPEEDKVGPSRVRAMLPEPAMAGASVNNPNTANKFPGDSGIKPS